MPLALDNPSFVFSQYLVGITPLLIQLRSVPLSIGAMELTEKSSIVNVTIEYPFWKVVFEIVCRNWVVCISASEIPKISPGTEVGISGFEVWVWSNASLALIVKSVVLRFKTSVLRYLTSVFNWLISCWRSS